MLHDILPEIKPNFIGANTAHFTGADTAHFTGAETAPIKHYN